MKIPQIKNLHLTDDNVGEKVFSQTPLQHDDIILNAEKVLSQTPLHHDDVILNAGKVSRRRISSLHLDNDDNIGEKVLSKTLLRLDDDDILNAGKVLSSSHSEKVTQGLFYYNEILF